MEIDNTESCAISYLRIFALASIVLCHFLQSMDNKWAWVLNVGVQIFFFISGYLFGHKEIFDWTSWWKRRIKKIYVPYIISLFVFIPSIIVLTNSTIASISVVSYIFDTQWFVGGVRGLGHLWFLTAIALCYLTTPILQTFRNCARTIITILLVYSIYEILLMRYDVKLFMPIFIYSFGYLYSLLGRNGKIAVGCSVTIITTLILLRITWQHIMQYDGILNQALHVYGGITLSILIIESIQHIWQPVKIPDIAKMLDKYSYEIYLVHHPIILGPLSIMAVCEYTWVNILLIIVLTIVLAAFLKWVSAMLRVIVK